MTRAQVGSALVSLIMVGCGTSASSSTAATATASPTAASTAFVSTIYHYTMTLPAGWTAYPATKAWTGEIPPSHLGQDVDLFIGSDQNAPVWAFALHTPKTLTAFTTQLTTPDTVHSCAKPERDQATTLGGVPARFVSMHCPATGGILVLSVIAVKSGIGYAFFFQDATGVASNDADRAAFAKFVSSVRLP